ncbi:MAG: hypothetical protein PGN11_21740 [Quadrisphaera sp.]
MECWGGATYDVALRFLGEDPWDRLAALREAMPNLALQMLLRGRNTVGYTPYPEAVTRAFVAEATATGVDVFRIFDALNDITQIRPAIDAVLETGTAVAEGTLCYTSDLFDPSERLYTLDYYLSLAEQIVEAGAHVLAVKDMAGLLRPPAAKKLVSALRQRFDLPVHLHTHDTAGGQLATLLAAVEAGVDAVDVASAPMAGTTSQPPASALVAALRHTDRDTGLDLRAVMDLEPYWEAVRRLYAPFESGIGAPHRTRLRPRDPRRPALQPPPAGHRPRRRGEVRTGRSDVPRRRPHPRPPRQGHPPPPRSSETSPSTSSPSAPTPRTSPPTPSASTSPTPSSASCPESSATRPAAGPSPSAPRRSRAAPPAPPPPRPPSPPDDATALAAPPDLGERGTSASRRDLLNRLLFPGPSAELARVREAYGDVSVLDTRDYLYGLRRGEESVIALGRGVSLIAGLEAVGEPDERALRTVMTVLNGQLRPVAVRDRTLEVSVASAEKADPSRPGHVASPFAGVVTLVVGEGDAVEAGQTVATIEAMKMEASITTPRRRRRPAPGHREGAAGRGRRPRRGDHDDLSPPPLASPHPRRRPPGAMRTTTGVVSLGGEGRLTSPL